MTQEDKQLLLQDLCARSPYGVKVRIVERGNNIRTINSITISDGVIHFIESDTISPFGLHIENPITLRQAIKPYLRPMSSMTEEEIKEFAYTILCQPDLDYVRKFNYLDIQFTNIDKIVDWLNSHHFDYRGLIEKGLALPAPEGMYNV